MRTGDDQHTNLSDTEVTSGGVCHRVASMRTPGGVRHWGLFAPGIYRLRRVTPR
jgi:hypothetical protein